MCKKKDY
jgi:ribosomal protein S15P/S13E